LPFGPKNHSKLGAGEMKGRGESTMVAEHIREKLSAPAVTILLLLEVGEVVMVTFSSVPKLTVRTNKLVFNTNVSHGGT
jgi:hypothetical protein